ncbi:protoporphyrinogen oxidase [Mangrovactinospora gilvigrisea]|uniref:Coproporphyrinogen III oxidase n=1 Tax=Mangrovactinospora gilvigrisea TaxID=1428644 RepID=A0A1J7BA74_9ACTN|nr:protoporphyrinogen oxidase [Mangrovactinospora gilvigrisea]
MVVVGGGIAGLAAAWELAGRGVAVTVLEASARVGGKLRAGEVGGVTVDLGAEAMIARRPEGVRLAREVGLGDALEPPATTGSAIWSRGAMRPMPKGHLMGVPADPAALAASGVLSAAGLERIALEPRLPAAPLDGDVSVGQFVAARLGREVVDRLVEPLLGGVYAGNADRISLQAAIPQLYALARQGGSLLEAVGKHLEAARAQQAGAGGAPAPVFTGVRGGLGRLPQAVAEALAARDGAELRTGIAVTRLRRAAGGRGWLLDTEGPDGARELAADAVVLAVPAPAAAVLLERHAPAAAAELAAVEYADMALVTMAFRGRAIAEGTLNGSGFLVPPVEGRTIKASTFSANKWAWVGAQDPGTVVLRASVGRHGEERDLGRDDAELVALARADLRRAVGLAAEPVDTAVTRWHRGLPQYPVGQPESAARIRRGVAALGGIEVCGAAYDGVGVPACIGGARAAAGRIADAFDKSEVHEGQR